MRIVITHTDLRLYWPARIAALQRALEARGDELFTVEIAGKGSPYAFSGEGVSLGGLSVGGLSRDGAEAGRNWIRLFPERRMEDLLPGQARRALFAKLNELQPDVVLSGGIAYPSGAASVYWTKRRRRAVIIFDDVRPEDVPRNAVVDFVKKLIYSQVDAILCPAEPWVDGFRRWGFRKGQLFFGVDVVDNESWSRPVGLPGSAGLPGLAELPGPYLLAVGRQIVVKNFLFLLKAYEAYREEMGDVDSLPLVFVGEGPERKMLESYVWARGLKDVYLFPFVAPEVLRGFYHRAAALVLPSKAETWGLVVNEAMAAGLPVLVSTACGCASVLVEDGVNGFTFPPDRQGGLVGVLVRFTRMPVAAKAAMGRASQAQVQHWGLERFVNGSMAAIDYAVAHKKTCWSMPIWLVLRSWKGRYRPV